MGAARLSPMCAAALAPMEATRFILLAMLAPAERALPACLVNRLRTIALWRPRPPGVAAAAAATAFSGTGGVTRIRFPSSRRMNSLLTYSRAAASARFPVYTILRGEKAVKRAASPHSASYVPWSTATAAVASPPWRDRLSLNP